MDNPEHYQGVLAVFAHYGFRKASMADLANAAGVSRQTLYNRLRDKEAVLDWAVRGIVEFAHARAEQELYAPALTPAERLVSAFARKMGDFVPMLHESLHGWEIMDRGIDSLARADIDTDARFSETIAQFLLEQGIADGVGDAADRAFVLFMAAKGLMLRCQTTEAFCQGMHRAVNVIVQPRSITLAAPD